MLGGKISVPTMNGNEQLDVPKGTKADARFRVRGKGLPNVSGGGQGDLYVAVRVEIPTKVSLEQKSLIEELDKTMPQKSFGPSERRGGANQTDRPFFDRVKDIFG